MFAPADLPKEGTTHDLAIGIQVVVKVVVNRSE
jgi:predicted ATPase with chaperone activity